MNTTLPRPWDAGRHELFRREPLHNLHHLMRVILRVTVLYCRTNRDP